MEKFSDVEKSSHTNCCTKIKTYELSYVIKRTDITDAPLVRKIFNTIFYTEDFSNVNISNLFPIYGITLYRRSGNFRCYNIFVNVRAYENLTHEYF